MCSRSVWSSAGPFLPLAVIMYWLSNNIWTYGQQHYVFGMIEKEEEAKKAEALERRSANAPAPGAKPKRGRKPDAGAPAEADDPADAEADVDEAPKEAQKDAAGGSAGPSVNRTPKPGARPKKRKR